MFLANYSDGLADLDLETYVRDFKASGKIGSFLSIPAPHTFHIVHADAQNLATKLELVGQSTVRVNGGFFAFRREIFDFMNPGEELVLEPFQRLMERREIIAVPHDGFWQNMDTFKDKMQLDEMSSRGHAPWKVWER
jgi:glucose-1-phosphate cytidylyltransferase